MSTISNAVLNSLVASHSNYAIAGIGIAKKIDMMAYAVAQGMTQGVLSLIGYNYAAGNVRRMKKLIATSFLYSVGVATAAMILLLILAKSVTGLFINDAQTVEYGQKFLRTVCLACPTTALNFMIITVFQATKRKAQPLILSFLRKGTLDVALMFFINSAFGVEEILWATPLADLMALVIALMMFIPYIKSMKNGSRI